MGYLKQTIIRNHEATLFRQQQHSRVENSELRHKEATVSPLESLCRGRNRFWNRCVELGIVWRIEKIVELSDEDRGTELNR